MYGWLIVLIALAIAFVGVIIWNIADPCSDYAFPIACLIFSLVALLSIINIAVYVDGKNFSKRMETQQEFFDKSISGFDEWYDYTIRTKVFNINQKIYETRNSKELWGNWSSCYYVSDDVLVPITLNKIDSTKIK